MVIGIPKGLTLVKEELEYKIRKAGPGLYNTVTSQMAKVCYYHNISKIGWKGVNKLKSIVAGGTRRLGIFFRKLGI